MQSSASESVFMVSSRAVEEAEGAEGEARAGGWGNTRGGRGVAGAERPRVLAWTEVAGGERERPIRQFLKTGRVVVEDWSEVGMRAVWKCANT